MFYINRETEQVVSYEQIYDHPLEKLVDEEAAKEIAIEYVQKYYDPALYQISLVRGLIDKERGQEYDSYIFSFYRMIDDINLSSIISVTVGTDGVVYGYSDYMNSEIQDYIDTYGESKIVDDYNRLKEVDIVELIGKTVMSISDVNTYDILAEIFTIDESNHPALIYRINIETSNIDQGEMSGELISIIIRDDPSSY